MAESQTATFAREVGRGLDEGELPAYAPMLAALHRAHADQLRSMLAALPIGAGSQILDMACGDGCYTVWLAERAGPGARVVGVDIAPAFLDLARRRAAESPRSDTIHFELASVESLPFDQGSFDLAWCAQSLYSLPDPVAALAALRHVVRPGGAVAVLENDTLHHVLVPWPAPLELAARQAQLRALEASGTATGKYFAGRQLCAIFKTAGLKGCVVTPFSMTSHAPIGDDERFFLTAYFRDLGSRAKPYLDGEARHAFDMLLDPASSLFLLDQPDFYVTYVYMLAVGRRPE